METLSVVITLFLAINAEGLLLNLNHTNEVGSVEERLEKLEKSLTEEKRQRYILQIEFDQEKETIKELREQLNETDQKLLQIYNPTPKRLQDISTQIRGALLSINTLETNYGADIQKVFDALREVQIKVANLTSNQSEIATIQRHFQEKEIVLSRMINAIKHNQTMDQKELAQLKTSLTTLANTQSSLENTVNTNANIQRSLQSQLSEMTNPFIFLATPARENQAWILGYNPSVTANVVVKFPTIKINIGRGYDSNTGVFTCPSDGYYVFHWSLAPYGVGKCSSAIMKNNVEIIGNEVGGNLATFHMNRNDRAWIKVTSDCTMSYHHSSFSGFKLI